MKKSLFCIKLNREAEGLSSPPFPGELGNKIFEQVSQQAWNEWLTHQTMLINEYRLNLAESKSREFLLQELQNYFFGEGSQKPQRFVNIEEKNK